MNTAEIFDAINSILNSAVGIAVIWAALVALFLWLSSEFNPFQEKWRAWEGSIITAIKLAEKEVPDNIPDKGLAKLDAALRFVIQAYADAHSGKHPSAKLIEHLKQGIQIKHHELDRFGKL